MRSSLVRAMQCNAAHCYVIHQRCFCWFTPNFHFFVLVLLCHRCTLPLFAISFALYWNWGAHVAFSFFFIICVCFDKHEAHETFTMEIREKKTDKCNAKLYIYSHLEAAAKSNQPSECNAMCIVLSSRSRVFLASQLFRFLFPVLHFFSRIEWYETFCYSFTKNWSCCCCQ